MNSMTKKELNGELDQEIQSRLHRLEEKQRKELHRQQLQIEELVERVARMEGFLLSAVGKMMPKVEELLARHSTAAPQADIPSTTTAPSSTIAAPSTNATHASAYPSLHEAAKHGDVKSLRQMLAAGRQVNARDASGNTALHVAAERGHVSAVEALLEGGAWLETRGAMFRVPLHMAAAEGHVHVVRRLMELGAAVMHFDDQWYSPLSLAAARGQTAALEALLQSSVGPEELKCCLLVAGNGDVARLLLDDARLLVDEVLGERAIDKAASDGRLGALEALLQKGFRYSGALCEAAEGGRAAILRVFLCAGCDPNVSNSAISALHFAVRNGDEESVRVLLEAGADVAATDSQQYTPLHFAALNGATRCARLLLDAGADVSASSKYGTPLKVAQEKGHMDIVQLLREKGVTKPNGK